jgi:alkylation response protein AidB-like acyl-CoA dehydrogenase
VPALSLVPLLTQGAADLLLAHGSDDHRRLLVPHLVTGEWTATMQLSEPQSGSDLSQLKTRAEPAGEGTYLLRGTKIFISGGEHDLAPNIVHLVLGRLPDAPEGTRGISLFVLTKYLVEDDGRLGVRNDIRCVGLEHKLGFHGSPTCVMAYGENEGARCTLVGEPHRGLAAMFVMMNSSRLMVGVQGVSVAERATQAARTYAAERRQGRAPGARDGPQVTIDAHPDVRRMLATMAARTAAARAICLEAAVVFDLARHAEAGDRDRHAARLGLITPVAKAFATDVGVEVASTGIQVHGGMGYIEETGAAQHYRDARVLPIYEGTNGIQAVDLVGRKLRSDGAAAVAALIADIRGEAERVLAGEDARLGAMGYRLTQSADDLAEATDWLLELGAGEEAAALAGASAYLRLLGLTLGGALLARGALAAVAEGETASAAARRALGLARFYAENLMVETGALRQSITAGAPSLLALEQQSA